MGGNRQYKDTVFTDLFYSDQDAERNLLSLYNALYGTDFKDEGAVEKVRLDDVIFMKMKNDLAAVIGGKRLFLCEHQSTINKNMPLRMLMYAGREYEKLIKTELRYHKKLELIPTPQFVTFYNGSAPYPLESELRLTDAFKDKEADKELELKVKVININAGSGHRILESCEVLREYSEFIGITRERFKEDPEHGIMDAVRECIRKDILREYLSRRGEEVVGYFTDEYDYDLDVKIQDEELAEDMAKEMAENMAKDMARGMAQGIAQNMAKDMAKDMARESEARLLRLNGILIDEGRYDDLKRITTDSSFREKLMKEYAL